MKLNTFAICLGIFLTALLRATQAAPTDPVSDNLFPPELPMRFGDEIGLSDEQRGDIMQKMKEAQPRFETLQQQLQKEVERLAELLKNQRVDEKAALAQFEKVQS